MEPSEFFEGSISYVPESDYVGPDSFTYQITDGTHFASATVAVNVTGPVAVNDNYVTAQNATLTMNAANGVLQKNRAPTADRRTAHP